MEISLLTSADAQAVVSLKLKPTAQVCAAGRPGREGVSCRAEVPFWTHPGKIPTCLFVSMKLPRRLKRKMQFIGKKYINTFVLFTEMRSNTSKGGPPCPQMQISAHGEADF